MTSIRLQRRGFLRVAASSNFQATLWSGGSGTALGSINGGGSQAFAINGAGQIAGAINLSNVSNDWHPVVWSGLTPTQLGQNNGIAFAINNAGQAAGQSDTALGPSATIWNGPTATILSSAALPSAVYSINDFNQSAGFSGYQATQWNGIAATDLAGSGGIGVRAHATNNLGEVVGYSWTTGNATVHATYWKDGTLTELGALGLEGGVAKGINNASQVVGYAYANNGAQHATLWSGTKAIDLNSFLDASAITAGWELAVANGINDQGAIVGVARNSITGQNLEAFLLAPVPEPETYALLLAGLGLLGVVSRRRMHGAAG